MTAGQYLARLDRAIEPDEGFHHPSPERVREGQMLALAAIAASLNTLAKKETEPR